MTLQFLYCVNPNKEEQGAYILHVGSPSFLARIEGDQLTIVRKYDGEDANYDGKLSRALAWYKSFKNRR